MRSEGYGSRHVSVRLSNHISPLGFLFVVKTLPRTQHATKVKKFVAFSLKLRHSRARHFPHCTATVQSAISLGGIRACASKIPS